LDLSENGFTLLKTPVMLTELLMNASVTDIFDRKHAENEQKNLESQIQQAQMMEAIATLAGGIAHQFNNALTGIGGNIELMEMALFEGRDTAVYSERIKALIGNMTYLTDQLLAYARGGKYRPKAICLSHLVKESLPMIHHRSNPAIRIETQLPENILHVIADFTQMKMVLSSVVANAIEAIHVGPGHIRITTKCETMNEGSALYYPGVNAGTYVSLTVEDDGKGMDENTKSRLFEPFFTTKFQGRGLGMAAVYGIIKNHDGFISVDSEIDKGTTVRIFLPAVEIPIEKVEKPKSKIFKGAGNILVIEDEDMVMDVSCAMFETLGYHVLGARTGKEAVDIASTFKGHIDLAFLDMGLPDMGGEKVYSLIKKISPNTKVIACSGYAIDGPAQEIMAAGAHGFLQKPYSLAILSEKLKEVLNNN